MVSLHMASVFLFNGSIVDAGACGETKAFTAQEDEAAAVCLTHRKSSMPSMEKILGGRAIVD